MLHVTNRLRRIVFCALLCLPLVGCVVALPLAGPVPTTPPTAGPTVSPSITGYRAADTGREWDYVVEQKATGALYVSIHLDMNDAAALEQYVHKAREAARALAETETGDVPVHLTPAEPLTGDAVRALAEETGLVLEHVTVELRTRTGDLETAGFDATGRDVAGAMASLEGSTHRVVGAVLLEGRAPAASLAALAEDPRIYIVDTLHRDLAREVAEEYGVPLDAVDVWAPSPFWSMAVERGEE
jgi:hypothetical protein